MLQQPLQPSSSPLTECEIQFELNEPGRFRLSVCCLDGHLVSVLADENFPSGTHTVKWQSGGFPAGLYIMKMEDRFGAVSRRFFVKR